MTPKEVIGPALVVAAALSVGGYAAFWGVQRFYGGRVYMQLSVPQPCRMIRPVAERTSTNTYYFNPRPGPITLEFDCGTDRHVVRARVGAQDWYGEIDPRVDREVVFE